VATAHHDQPIGVGRVDQQRGGEVLVLEEPRQVGAHLVGDLGEGRAQRSGLPEGPDDPRGVLDGGDPLAPDVSDEEPGVDLRVVAVVQVAAHDRVLGRGQVAGGDGHPLHAGREPGQDRALGDLSDRHDPFVLLLAGDPDTGHHHARPAHQDDVDDPHILLRGPPGVVPEAGGGAEQDGRDREHRGDPGRQHRAGDQRGEREQGRQHDLVPPGGEVDGDGDGEPGGRQRRADDEATPVPEHPCTAFSPGGASPAPREGATC
jgi:hypothetical protein